MVCYFATYNVRGLSDIRERRSLAEDLQKYRISISAICETKLKTNESEGNQGHISITGSEGNKYDLYYCGDGKTSYHGVGIAVDSRIKGEFTRISDRICKFTVNEIKQLNVDSNRRLIFIAAYAPTLAVSEKTPEIADKYYADLNNVTESVPKRDILIIGTDSNAKCGSAKDNNHPNLGLYGKGVINSSGVRVIDFARRNDLVLTNTLFYQKQSHRTTWTAPERIQPVIDSRSKTQRRNPYRNQIDFILVRNTHRQMIQLARSHGDLTVSTDHKLVRLTMNFSLHLCFKNKTDKADYNVRKLHDSNIRAEYSAKQKEFYLDNTSNMSNETPQDMWNNIVNASLKAAQDTIKNDKTIRQCDSVEAQKLSARQKELRNKIESIKDSEERARIKKERNRVLKQLHKVVADEDSKRIDTEIQHIESISNDSNRMYRASQFIRSMKPKQQLILQGKEGLTSNENDCAQILTDHFSNVFFSKDAAPMPVIPPAEMREPFHHDEVKKAVNSMKNNKSCGCDQIKAELIKYGDQEIITGIACLLNKISSTGQYPTEIKKGLLVPLPKPGKKRGPPANCRPVILLSTLRKILAIIMIRRTAKKMMTRIPPSQAAYISGRGTTEQVLAMKLLIEKAITSSFYQILLRLLDMSKAFDTIDRAALMNDLSEVLDPDELHMFYILLKDVEIEVKVNNISGKPFITNVGSPQGDSASAFLFIYYLAITLRNMNHITVPTITPTPTDHDYVLKATPEYEHDQQYADDCSWATTSTHTATCVEENVPPELEKRKLNANADKTEIYDVRKDGPEEWKKCKYLGSLFDTEADITRRKGLAYDTFNNIKKWLTTPKSSISNKIKRFEAFVSTIFLYNSEIWTLTKKLEDKIDVLQRSFLRRIIGISRADRVSNDKLYEMTKTIPWSKTIRNRRMRFLGHILRLPENTPVRKAPAEHLRPVKGDQDRGFKGTSFLSIAHSHLDND